MVCPTFDGQKSIVSVLAMILGISHQDSPELQHTEWLYEAKAFERLKALPTQTEVFLAFLLKYSEFIPIRIHMLDSNYHTIRVLAADSKMLP